jgi:hypothetical protein
MSLDNLSNEVLFLVAKCLLADIRARFDDGDRLHRPRTIAPFIAPPVQGMGTCSPSDHVSGVNVSPVQLASGLSGLNSLSLTSRRFRAIVERLLFNAPTLSLVGGLCDEKLPIYLFTRTLVEHPSLAKRTGALRINLPQCWGASMQSNTSEPKETYRTAAILIGQMNWMDNESKTIYKWQLQRLRPVAFCSGLMPGSQPQALVSGYGPCHYTDRKYLPRSLLVIVGTGS